MWLGQPAGKGPAGSNQICLGSPEMFLFTVQPGINSNGLSALQWRIANVEQSRDVGAFSFASNY